MPIIVPYHPNPEQFSANLWFAALSSEQQIWLDLHYQIPVGASPYAILLAYRNRDETHKHPDWPEAKLRSV